MNINERIKHLNEMSDNLDKIFEERKKHRIRVEELIDELAELDDKEKQEMTKLKLKLAIGYYAESSREYYQYRVELTNRSKKLTEALDGVLWKP